MYHKNSNISSSQCTILSTFFLLFTSIMNFALAPYLELLKIVEDEIDFSSFIVDQ